MLICSIDPVVPDSPELCVHLCSPHLVRASIRGVIASIQPTADVAAMLGGSQGQTYSGFESPQCPVEEGNLHYSSSDEYQENNIGNPVAEAAEIDQQARLPCHARD